MCSSHSSIHCATNIASCPTFLFRFELESCSDIRAVVISAKSFKDALRLFSAIHGKSRLPFVISIHRLD